MGAEDLVANGQDVVVIEYHISDVFETSYAVARQTYYWVTALPTVRFDGIVEYVGGNNTTSMYDTYLPIYEERKAIMSDFTIDVEGTNSMLTDYAVEISVEMVAQNNSSNLALIVALTETHIDYYWMGQDYVNYCERFMWPDAAGTSLDLNLNEPEEFNLTFSLDPEWVQEKCELAVWIQDMSSKEVHQATKRSLAAFGGYPERDAFLQNIYTPVTICSETMEPGIEVKNLGSQNLESLDIVYQLNSQTAQTFSWTGSIPSMESELITLPSVNMQWINAATFNATLENPNGMDDEFIHNDTSSSYITKAGNVSSPVTLVLKLDDFPEQTSWELLNSSNVVLYSGGNYVDPGVFVTEVFDLSDTDCYSFKIYDSAGDGLTGTGLYKLMYGTTIFQNGKYFNLMDEAQFGLGLVGVPESSFSAENQVYPNPVSGKLYVEVGSTNRYELLDLNGRLIRTEVLSKGLNSIELADELPGLYFLKLQADQGIEIHKILVK